MNPKVSGVYIVVKNENKLLVLRHFNNFIRGDEVEIKTIELPNFPSGLKGDDGKEVTTNPGDLLMVNNIDVPRGYGFHLANVGPADEKTAILHEYALSKLGLGIKPKFDKAILLVDGHFRKLLTSEERKKYD